MRRPRGLGGLTGREDVASGPAGPGVGWWWWKHTFEELHGLQSTFPRDFSSCALQVEEHASFVGSKWLRLLEV